MKDRIVGFSNEPSDKRCGSGPASSKITDLLGTMYGGAATKGNDGLRVQDNQRYHFQDLQMLQYCGLYHPLRCTC
jgi:hypothetical protein